MDEGKFPGTLESLAPVRDWVASIARAAGLGRRAVYNLCLAVDEIVTNIVAYGYDAAGLKGDLKLSAQVEGGNLVIYLEDQGTSYDFQEHRCPSPEDLALPLERRAAGGLGIMLAKTGVSDLSYTATKDANVHRFAVPIATEPE